MWQEIGSQLAVFAMTQLTETGLAVPEAGADNHIQIGGSAASWPSITSEAFLPDPKPGSDQTLIRDGDQTSKVAVGQSLNEIQQKLWTHVYENDEVRELDQNRTTTIQKDDKLTIIGNRNTEITKNRDTKIKENDSLTITGKRTVKVSKNRDTTITENDDLTVSGRQHTKVKADVLIETTEGPIVLHAADGIVLTTGSSLLQMTKDGVIVLSGVQILSTATVKNTIIGGEVHLNPE